MHYKEYIKQLDFKIKLLEDVIATYRIAENVNENLIKSQERYISELEKVNEELLAQLAILKKGSE